MPVKLLATWTSLLVLLCVPGCSGELDTGHDDDDDSGGDDDDTGDDDDSGGTADDDDSAPPDQDVFVWPPAVFGDVTLGCSETAETQIVNIGEEPVTVLGTAMDPDDGQYTLVPPVEWPLTIYPGFDLEVDVTYHPQTVAAHEVAIAVETDHPDLPLVEGRAEGSGVSAGQQTDSFVGEDVDRVDLLWVVDNSCSMYEEQTALAANAAAFLDYLDDAGIDYQVGVVTTDSASMGASTITPTTPDAAAAFAAAVALGTSGSGTEQPLLQAYAAVTPPLIDPGGANEGFVRDGAGLAVVILTDEDDQSGGTAATWATQFLDLKPDHDLIAISGITGLATGCATAYATPILSEVVALTGGLEVSICDPDWSPVLSVAAGLVAGPAIRFGLSQQPMPQTLAVAVDGVAVEDGWSYAAEDNAVVFDDPPADGSAIDVTYEIVGDCPPE